MGITKKPEIAQIVSFSHFEKDITYIIGYLVGDELTCRDCFTAEERSDVALSYCEHGIEIYDGKLKYICDRCKKDIRDPEWATRFRWKTLRLKEWPIALELDHKCMKTMICAECITAGDACLVDGWSRTFHEEEELDKHLAESGHGDCCDRCGNPLIPLPANVCENACG